MELPDIYDGDAEWTDFDLDGDQDILLTGNNQTYLYVNNNGNFTPSHSGLRGMKYSSMSTGDYDNDGDPDLALEGRNVNLEGYDQLTEVYQNTRGTNSYNINTPPQPPLETFFDNTDAGLRLSWLPGSDDHTPDQCLSYNLLVGISPGSINITAPESDPETGYRRIAKPGNAGYDTSYLLKNLQPGMYYYQIQTIDGAYIGSEFSPVDIFYVYETTAPTLVHPYPNQDSIHSQDTFTWLPLDNYSYYHLEIAFDSLFL